MARKRRGPWQRNQDGCWYTTVGRTLHKLGDADTPWQIVEDAYHKLHAKGEKPAHLTVARVCDEFLDYGKTHSAPDQLASQLLAVLQANEGLSWVSFGDKDGNFTGAYRPVEGGLRINQSHIADGRSVLVEHDALPDGTRRLFREDKDSKYDPRLRPYYVKAKDAGRLVWLPPYVFFNQGVPGVSCAAPIYDDKHQLLGVVSVDFDLQSLSDFVSNVSLSENSDVFLFTSDEILLAHRNRRKANQNPKNTSGKLLKLSDADDKLVDAMQKRLGSAGPKSNDDVAFKFFDFRSDGEDYFASTTAFRVGDDLKWMVGVIAPQADFLRGVWRSQTLSLAIGAGALGVAGLLAAAMARRVSGPILSLIDFMHRVGHGDLDAKASFSSSREFRQLSVALNRMIADLRDRLRLRHSLNIAMEVQQRLLPSQPPKPMGLDVAGHSTYCDETGGDYYDFLMLDETQPDNVLVALGDVMGHGVAAALVMAGVRAVLRDRAITTGSLSELMGRLNSLLAADLDGTRFMTMYLAVINPREGIRWVSAGHDPAIVYDPVTDSFVEIEGGDLPLGIMNETEYVELTYPPLRPGQILVVGTDGVWEMPNQANELFGKQRLREAIQSSATQSAATIVQTILDCLAAFRGDCRPIDDVTFLIVKAKEIRIEKESDLQ